MTRFDTISFLTDYGLADEFVGVVKSVIRTVAPTVGVVDITHQIDPHDVRAGGLALARSVQYLAPGVLLAVVDPGVGTDRRAVAVEVADGGAYLVGPDNGLLAPAVSMVGGATGAFVLDNTEYHLPTSGPTFAGRDVFGPVAAHLCLGVPADELGTPIDPVKLLPGVLPVSEANADGSIRAEVLWVDHFGNAQLNVDPGELADWPGFVQLAGAVTRTAHRVETYASIPTGSIGLVIDSYGLLSLAVDRGSAAFELQLDEGQEITLSPTDGPASTPSPVTISARPTITNPEDAPRPEGMQ